MLYDEKIFQKVVREMKLSLDYKPDYSEAINRMKVFYPEGNNQETQTSGDS